LTAPFAINEVDRAFYAARLRDFLPARIIDIHTHVWLKRFQAPPADGPTRIQTWPRRVAEEQSVEDLTATYRVLFPGKQVTPLLFANAVNPADDLDGGNAYAAECARRHAFPALLFAHPRWTAPALEERLQAGGFRGVKVYLTLADPGLPEAAIRIFDYLPPHQLDVLNRLQGIVMLHIPRPGRLRDPENLAQLLEIERRWPEARLIVAHVGRAYCPEDVGDAFEVLKQTKRMLFDIAANTNADVFRRLIETVGPRRILFGSDLPITRMRMRRLCEAGRYVNLVPRGLYGDVSDDAHMREVDGEEAARLTLFLYEEIEAFRLAAAAARLSQAEIAAVFHDNAATLLGAMTEREATP
jgi:uncharacterized protein